MKRHEIHVLAKAGLGQREIARKAGISERSVYRILQEDPPQKLRIPPDADSGSRGRPSTARPYVEVVQEIFKAEPTLPSIEVLRRTRLKGYTGGKSALYELIASLRPRVVAPVVRFEGVPGEFSQHDFGHVRVTYVGTGEEEVLHFFASRLKWSRWSHVILVPDERVESLVRALLEALTDFQGVPLVCVFDNPKTIALSHIGSKIEWNPTFAQVAMDLRVAAELCTPSFANQKGAVENLVKWVKNSFFKVRRFHDREDLKVQLAQWLREINLERPSRATRVTPVSRIEQERKRFRPLPVTPEDYALRIPVQVSPTGHVDYEGVRYSMPARALGIPGTLFLYRDRVRVIAGRFSAEHPRRPETPGISWKPEHRADMLAFVSGERGKLYLKRQQIFELGSDAVDFLTEIVHARPRVWKPDVEKLYELLVEHGGQRLLEAMREAAGRRLFGAEYVAQLLRKEPA